MAHSPPERCGVGHRENDGRGGEAKVAQRLFRDEVGAPGHTADVERKYLYKIRRSPHRADYMFAHPADLLNVQVCPLPFDLGGGQLATNPGLATLSTGSSSPTPTARRTPISLPPMKVFEPERAVVTCVQNAIDNVTAFVSVSRPVAVPDALDEVLHLGYPATDPDARAVFARPE